MSGKDDQHDQPEEPVEIAVVGDLIDHEGDICEKLLSVPQEGECTLYFNSPGGSAYGALSMMTLILLRRLNATGVVTGECASAALWPFAACKRRIVTAHSVLLFHPLKWQSEESVLRAEAAEWARHFTCLEKDMDGLLARLLGLPLPTLTEWCYPGRYVSGREFADLGLAEFVDLAKLADD